MALININLDLSGLVDFNNTIKERLDRSAKRALEALNDSIYNKILEEAKGKLNTTYDLFVDNLSVKYLSDTTSIISCNGKVRFLNDGLPAHNMLSYLLVSPNAKVSKTGNRYLIVPFKHKSGTSKGSGESKQALFEAVQKQMKLKGISEDIEKDEKGVAKLGLLHKFDISDAPKKQWDKPGQGHGPIGQVMQSKAGRPFLHGVRIYQSAHKDKGGAFSVKKSIMTFRTASDKQKSSGMWDHPGIQPTNIMQNSVEWIKNSWEKEILPKVIEAFHSEV